MGQADGTGQERDELPPWEKEALEALRWHWGDAYEIGRDDASDWHARRRDGLGGLLTGAGPDELGQAVVADYSFRPVPPGSPGGRRSGRRGAYRGHRAGLAAVGKRGCVRKPRPTAR
jgi:hypothetical protein